MRFKLHDTEHEIEQRSALERILLSQSFYHNPSLTILPARTTDRMAVYTILLFYIPQIPRQQANDGDLQIPERSPVSAVCTEIRGNPIHSLVTGLVFPVLSGSVRLPDSSDPRLPTLDLRPSTFDFRLSTFDFRLSTFDLRLSTFDLRLSTFDFRPSTFDLRLSTFDFRLSTFDLPTLNPRPRRPGRCRTSIRPGASRGRA